MKVLIYQDVDPATGLQSPCLVYLYPAEMLQVEAETLIHQAMYANRADNEPYGFNLDKAEEALERVGIVCPSEWGVSDRPTP